MLKIVAKTPRISLYSSYLHIRDFPTSFKLGPGATEFGKIALGLANWENSVKKKKKRDMHNLIMFKCKFDQRTLKLVQFDPVPEAVYTHKYLRQTESNALQLCYASYSLHACQADEPGAALTEPLYQQEPFENFLGGEGLQSTTCLPKPKLITLAHPGGGFFESFFK